MNKINDIPQEVKEKAIEKGIKKYYTEAGNINVYGIRDVKMGFVEIMTGKTDGIMIRNLHSAVKNKQTQVGQYPQDFELWKLGTMSENTGYITSEPKLIISASDLVEQN